MAIRHFSKNKQEENDMKKKVLLTAGMAALMTAGMAMTAFAGWEEHNGSWYFKNSKGEFVTDEWEQSGDFWYYLGDDGRMLTNTLIDDMYYVDANGARTVNGWQWLTDEWDDDDEGAWRYFGANGKIYTDGMKQINGVYYHFDDTKMSTGWVKEGDYTYYFKEDGSRTSGWKWLPENDEDSWNEYWYYFSAAGKLTTSATKDISGVDYAFDEQGRMLTGWVDTDSHTSTGTDNLRVSDVDNLRYHDDNGAAVNGWMLLDSPVDMESNYYYFRDGRAYSTKFRTTVPTGCDYGIVKIDNDYYCFNEDGKLVTGIVDSTAGPMYFDTENGKMRTGRVTVYTDDHYGETFFFKESGSIGVRGVGITGVDGSYLYEKGQLVCADDGMKYEWVNVGNKDYVVNESGKIKTSGTAKDADGYKYTITKNANGGYTIKKEYVD